MAVAAEHLRRSFGEKMAVCDVGLSIPPGAFFALVGPNGAGKSTKLKMLAGLLRPHGGRVEVCGRDVWPDPVAAKAGIGVLTEDLRLFDRLSGAELLVYNGLLRRMEPSVIEDRSAELLAVLGLRSAASTLVVDYSQGMKKKIALACALLHAPRVLLLDEPFRIARPSLDVGHPLEEVFFEWVGARSDAPGGLRCLGSSSAGGGRCCGARSKRGAPRPGSLW